MAQRRSISRARFVLMALSIALVGELPGMVLLRSALVPLAARAAWPVAMLVTATALMPLGARLWFGTPERFERGVAGASLLAFYVWWATSMVAGLLYLPALLVAQHSRSSHVAQLALVVGFVAALLGVLRRSAGRFRHIHVAIDSLPSALHGYRIAQLSDLHMGPYTPPERVRDWVDRINALGPDLVAITGDLITQGDRFVADVARELGRLRARDGVALAMGNHDYFGDHERLIDGLTRAGIEVLRNRGRIVERVDQGGQGIRYWLAGVDDTWRGLQDVPSALAGRPIDVPAIVLAHDPSLFDECAEHGATLVLSGHTHGGQIALPLFGRTFNIARIVHRYTAGRYRLKRPTGDAHLYVSYGAGTTGPPLRIGAPSEIAIITLRSA